MNQKMVFTTGEVANMLHIHQTTVIDWVDKGILKSYKTPGGHRRIQRETLIGFLNDHEMPIPNILSNAVQEILEEEKHRHLHESFQINPYTHTSPVNPRHPVRENNRKAKLAENKK